MQKRLNGRRGPRSPHNLALTADLVALTIRPIADPGPPPGVAYFDDADYPSILAQHPGRCSPGADRSGSSLLAR